MEEIRILHTSDVHIGAPFEFLGLKGQDHRNAVRGTFERVLKKAGSEGYQLVLIAGDLFDSAYDVRESDITFVIRSLSLAGKGCRIVILPGSHDYWSPGTVYERERGRFERDENVDILTPEKRTVELPELSLAVHGKALTSNVGSADAAAGLEPVGGLDWNIIMAHGSVEGAAAGGEPGEHPISIDRLVNDYDYVALGHWHSHRIIRRSDPPAIYSGSPELIARDQTGAGSVVSVILSREGVTAESIRVGTKRVERATVDCTGLDTTEGLVKRVRKAVPEDQDLVLELSLSGLIGVDALIDVALALEELSRGYFSVRLAGEGAAREISVDELLRIPGETVAGRFIRTLLERIEGASGDERAKLEEALQLGYQLFRGRNPL